MNVATDPYVWIAAILTLAVFSFLYKDNALFCFAEHLLVGLSTGYLICTFWHNVLVPELFHPLWQHGLGHQWHLFGAAALCFFWTCKYIKKLDDLFRFALAFWVAIDMGMAIPTQMESQVLAQVASTIGLSLHGSLDVIIGNAVLVMGTVAALTYFFFSKAHRGVVGGTAKVGVWILMIGFGATFSYTIMSRVYVLIGRVLFLLRDWLGVVS
jgi:hypothetical protein